MIKHRSAVPFLSILLLLIPRAGAHAQPGRASAPLVTAFSARGWVYGLRSDGSTVRLTAGTHALQPALSPDRSRVAYFSSIRGRTDRFSRPILSGVWTVGTRANPQTLVANLHGDGTGTLAWSPDGRLLAYAAGGKVAVWSGRGSPSRTVWRTSAGVSLGSAALAWSRDSRRLAVALPPTSLTKLPRVLRVAVADLLEGSSRVITVRFPPRLMGSQTTAAGSHPDASQIAWSADGVSLLVATTVNGAGNSLTGIWRAPASGGTAHLMVGSPTGGYLQGRDPALDNATHFLVSPDWRFLATDPGNQFWVARLDGRGGRFLAAHPTGVISQYRWLTGSQGLAYVSRSTVGGTASFRSTLSILQLGSGRARAATTVIGPSMEELSLAPPFRCVACG